MIGAIPKLMRKEARAGFVEIDVCLIQKSNFLNHPIIHLKADTGMQSVYGVPDIHNIIFPISDATASKTINLIWPSENT